MKLFSFALAAKSLNRSGHREINACLDVSSPFEAALLLAKMTLIGAAVVVPGENLDGLACWHLIGASPEEKMPIRSARLEW